MGSLELQVAVPGGINDGRLSGDHAKLGYGLERSNSVPWLTLIHGCVLRRVFRAVWTGMHWTVHVCIPVLGHS